MEADLVEDICRHLVEELLVVVFPEGLAQEVLLVKLFGEPGSPDVGLGHLSKGDRSGVAGAHHGLECQWDIL